MMRRRNHFLLFLAGGVLIALLLASVGLNVILYLRGEQYYRELNDVRLDPLGLNFYEAASFVADQPLVVFFGDSRAASWPAPDVAGFTFVNRGIGAQTSAQVAGRFALHVAPLQPDILILQVGINDLKTIPIFPDHKNAVIANCKTNIRQIVDDATRSEAMVILTTVFPVGNVPLERQLFWSDDVSEAVQEVNSFIESLQSSNVYVLDGYALLADETGKMRPEYSVDMLHLSEAGYDVLNSALVDIIADLDF